MGHQTAPILNPALRHVALHSIARQRREGKKLKTASLELFRSNSLLCNLQDTNLLQFLTQRKGMLLFVPSRVKGVQAVKLRLPAWSYFTPIRSCGTYGPPNCTKFRPSAKACRPSFHRAPKLWRQGCQPGAMSLQFALVEPMGHQTAPISYPAQLHRVLRHLSI